MRITFIGDIAIGSSLWHIRKPYRHVYSELRKGDLLFLNWEFPFTSVCKPESVTSYRGYSVQMALAKHLLSPLSGSLASLANNHVRDWGLEGIETTIRMFQEHNVAPIGIDLGIGNSQEPFMQYCH